MRPKSTGRNLPPRMLVRTRTLKSGEIWTAYYYNGRDEHGKRIEKPLGTDLPTAKLKWAELEGVNVSRPQKTIILMKEVFDRYVATVVPLKKPRTRKDNLSYIRWLRKVFDSAPIDEITQREVCQYLEVRSLKAPVRANREISLLSHIWLKARNWGYTENENPVKEVEKNKEKPRDYYVEDDVWAAVYEIAGQDLKDAMDINYLTGQRPADVRKMRISDIKDRKLVVKQNKTGKRLRILLDDENNQTELGRTIDRICDRPDLKQNSYLVSTADGKNLTESMLRTRFESARKAAANKALEQNDDDLAERIKKFQFRDIRPKTASDLDVLHASKLLGHSQQEITEIVYRRKGEDVKPTR